MGLSLFPNSLILYFVHRPFFDPEVLTYKFKIIYANYMLDLFYLLISSIWSFISEGSIKGTKNDHKANLGGDMEVSLVIHRFTIQSFPKEKEKMVLGLFLHRLSTRHLSLPSII